MKDLRLTIELIPSTAWYKNLRHMLGQTDWDKLRKKCYSDAGYRCEICGGKGNKWPVECHERWRFEEGKIILEGFIALCPSCHEVKHIGLASVKGRGEIAKRHFMKINGLSSVDASKYIEEAFDLFRERSEQEWEMDLDAIQQYIQ